MSKIKRTVPNPTPAPPRNPSGYDRNIRHHHLKPKLKR